MHEEVIRYKPTSKTKQKQLIPTTWTSMPRHAGAHTTVSFSDGDLTWPPMTSPDDEMLWFYGRMLIILGETDLMTLMRFHVGNQTK